MKRNIKLFIILLPILLLTGCDNNATPTPDINTEPTLEELAQTFSEVNLDYYVNSVSAAFDNFNNVEMTDFVNLVYQVMTTYSDAESLIPTSTQLKKYDNITDLGLLASYPSTTDENDAIRIFKDATLETSNGKEQVNVIVLQGTDMTDGQATGIKEDLLSGLELSNIYLYDAYQAILDTLDTKEDKEKPLLITGISLGGMVSQQLAGLDIIKNNYNVKYIVALGSPIIAPEKINYNVTSVKRIVDKMDLIPYLSQTASNYSSTDAERLAELEKLYPNNIRVERDGSSYYKTFIGAHTLGYVNEELWNNVDVLGNVGGNATLTVDGSKMFTISATNLEAHKSKNE